VAGSPPANTDYFLALRCQFKLSVKSTDSVNGAFCDIQAPGYFLYCAGRQIMESFLCFLEDGDEFFPVSRMAGEYFLKFSLFLDS